MKDISEIAKYLKSCKKKLPGLDVADLLEPDVEETENQAPDFVQWRHKNN